METFVPLQSTVLKVLLKSSFRKYCEEFYRSLYNFLQQALRHIPQGN